MLHVHIHVRAHVYMCVFVYMYVYMYVLLSTMYLCITSCRPIASTTTGRGVMSISGLSYGVVRVEEQGSITSLTLQDVGLVMPGGLLL